jgi:hypothetical protein
LVELEYAHIENPDPFTVMLEKFLTTDTSSLRKVEAAPSKKTDTVVKFHPSPPDSPHKAPRGKKKGARLRISRFVNFNEDEVQEPPKVRTIWCSATNC